jgi:hypothetical protein
MSWYDKYMINTVSIATLNKLVAAGKLTREEVDTMVSDRLSKHGY